jgi:hypothetical protein
MLGILIQQLTSSLVPFGLAVLAASLGFFAISHLHKRRQMLHQERMASLIKGLHYAGVAREIFTPHKPDSRDHLLRGLRWMLGSAGLSGTMYGNAMLQETADPRSALMGALVGLIPAAIGLAHLLFAWLSSRHQKQGSPAAPGAAGLPSIIRVPGNPGVVYRAMSRRTFFGR